MTRTRPFLEPCLHLLLAATGGRYARLEPASPLTEEELDERAEAFLNENFRGLEVDFEVDDALDKLIDDGSEVPARAKRIPLVKVIEGEGETRYQAIGFKEALVAMDGKWDRLFEYAD